MRSSVGKNVVGILAVVLLLIIAVPATSFGQNGRRGRGRDWNDRKCDKFVNCHDARDGRWDGRGPRRDSSRWSWRYNRRNDDWRRDRRRDNRFRDTRWRTRGDRWQDNDRWTENRLRYRRAIRDRFVRRDQNWDRRRYWDRWQ